MMMMPMLTCTGRIWTPPAGAPRPPQLQGCPAEGAPDPLVPSDPFGPSDPLVPSGGAPVVGPISGRWSPLGRAGTPTPAGPSHQSPLPHPCLHRNQDRHPHPD